jgi:hypothetical protein
VQEFKAQGAEEVRLRLPLTPIMHGLEDTATRNKNQVCRLLVCVRVFCVECACNSLNSSLEMFSAQVNFVDYVVFPLWTSFVEQFPEFKHLLQNVMKVCLPLPTVGTALCVVCLSYLSAVLCLLAFLWLPLSPSRHPSSPMFFLFRFCP